MADSRVVNTIRNFLINFLNKGLSLVLRFVLRTVFIHTLSVEYLGVNGLFSNILTLLSLADLGFGLALPYSLYKPLQEKDNSKISAIMDFYSKVYTIVGLTVFFVGISITPFLGSFVNGGDGIPNLWLIYILFVLNSSFSYLFIYKRTLITADQKDYLVTSIDAMMQLIIAIAQVISLFLLKNYIVYLSIQIVGTVTTNILISRKCDSLYPYIKNKPEVKLTRNEIGKTGKDVYALLIYKLASAVETGTDNIIVSKFLGIAVVGILSNYIMIIQAVQQILQVMFSSMTASIGNLIVSSSKEYTYKVYRSLNFASFWFYGVCSVCMWVMIQPFIESIWLDSSFLLKYSVVSILIINFYVCGTQNMNSAFRNAYGLFWQARYRPVCMIIVNIASSVVLVQKVGLVGVFIGTFLSRILTVGIMDPYVVHKYGLKEKVYKYHLDYSLYLVCMVAGYILVSFALSWIVPMNIGLWILKSSLSFVLINIFFLILFFKTERFKYLYNTVFGLIIKKIKK